MGSDFDESSKWQKCWYGNDFLQELYSWIYGFIYSVQTYNLKEIVIVTRWIKIPIKMEIFIFGRMRHNWCFTTAKQHTMQTATENFLFYLSSWKEISPIFCCYSATESDTELFSVVGCCLASCSCHAIILVLFSVWQLFMIGTHLMNVLNFEKVYSKGGIFLGFCMGT